MNRPRKKLAMAARRRRLTELYADGNTLRQCEEVLRQEGHSRIDHNTLARDINHVRLELNAATLETIQQHRDELLRKLIALEAHVQEHGGDDFVPHMLGIIDRWARLTGANLERSSPSLTVNVGAEGGRYLEFCRHSHGITETDWPKVFVFMDSLPREQLTIDASYYPPTEDARNAAPRLLAGNSSHEPSEDEPGGQP